VTSIAAMTVVATAVAAMRYSLAASDSTSNRIG
jgi:hypothetical protein